MTNTDQPDEKPASAQDWMAQANAYAARKQEIHPENRAALFDALERYAIQIVTMSFDGYGDSGQIDEISVTAGIRGRTGGRLRFCVLPPFSIP